MPTKPRIAIIGAGPIGLEAALYARLKDYDVTVYERGPVGGNVCHWAHVRMFSPFGMNASRWGRAALGEAGATLPADDAILSGGEFVEQYLHPLAQLVPLAERVCTRTPVLRVARARSHKTERIGDPERAQEPFLLLIRRIHEDREDLVPADVVIDCSGTYGNHNWLGPGGAPCPGELDAGPDIEYVIPHERYFDFSRLQAEQAAFREKMQRHLHRLKGTLPTIHCFAGERTLLVGSGHSAATTVTMLERMTLVDERTRILWLTRHSEAEPISRFHNDLLTARDELAAEANRLAHSSPAVEWIIGHVVSRIEWNTDGRKARITLQSVDGGREPTELVDRIIANVGYRPDRSLYEELQVHECYATQGPMKLAAKLLGETSVDCLNQTSHGPEVLRNPEPNFYILGMKSYGRNSNFLIRVGLQQIMDVFTLIEHDWGL